MIGPNILAVVGALWLLSVAIFGALMIYYGWRNAQRDDDLVQEFEEQR